MDEWIDYLLDCRPRSEAAVLITVAAVNGSAPRGPGTRMVVTATEPYGTIGGGHLELQAIAVARQMLAAGGTRDLRRFPLGASLGQCCGGLVKLMFEVVSPSASAAPWLDQAAARRARGQPCVIVSPAGAEPGSGPMVVAREYGGEILHGGVRSGDHANPDGGAIQDDRASRGRGDLGGGAGSPGDGGSLGDARSDAPALSLAIEMLASGAATRLASLEPGGPLLLFNSLRPPDFPIVIFGAGHVGSALVRILADLPCHVTWVDERADAFPQEAPANVRVQISDAPQGEVGAAAPASFFLVMTHSHALDQVLAEAILRRSDFRYFGLIGSATKRRQFEQRLAARGIGPDALARMVCPIGIAGIRGKEPAAIAVSVAAELLQVHSRVAVAR